MLVIIGIFFNILTLGTLRSAISQLLSGCFLPLDFLSEYRIQHGTIGPLYVTSRYSHDNWDILQGRFRLCNWLSLRRLVSWINHVPPVFLSTFWKSTFKQHLDCRFDIMDCKSSFFILTHAIVYVLIDHLIFRLYFYILNSVIYFYQVLLYYQRRSLYTFYSTAV